MGVAAHQFFPKFPGHGFKIKSFPLLGQLGMKNDMEENIAELLAEGVVIPLINGLEEFVYLFQNHGSEGAVVLFPVPGAAFRAAQPGHDTGQGGDLSHSMELRARGASVESERDGMEIRSRMKFP